MSKITRCKRCGGNIVEPAFEGDGAYPVGRMCDCEEVARRNPLARMARQGKFDEPDETYRDTAGGLMLPVIPVILVVAVAFLVGVWTGRGTR